MAQIIYAEGCILFVEAESLAVLEDYLREWDFAKNCEVRVTTGIGDVDTLVPGSP